MASKHKTHGRNEVVRCPNCGEDYSVTYKRCPFCDESAANSDGRHGGKRLNTRGGGYGGGGWGPLRVITTILSVVLIIAAAYIVLTIVKPLVELGSSGPETTASAAPSAAEPTAGPSAEASAEPTAEASAEPSADVTSGPVAAESFVLSISDITLSHAGETYRIRTTFSPSGATGSVSWSSSNPDCVHVASDGTVTALAKGNSTITAAMDSGYKQKCIIRCGWSDGTVYPTPGSGTATAAPAGNTELSINHTDVTLGYKGETLTLRISGTDSTVSWSSSNSSVASVSAAGKVTAASHGTVTITGSVDGQTLKCIVRCSF